MPLLHNLEEDNSLAIESLCPCLYNPKIDGLCWYQVYIGRMEINIGYEIS